MNSNLTVAIIAKDAEKTLGETLESVKWVKTIIVIDNESRDDTVKIAKEYTSNIYNSDSDDFSVKRNLVLSHLTTDWVFYLDSDEVMTEKLRREIEAITTSAEPAAYKTIRHNYFLGKRMYDDVVERLFHKTIIKKWRGKVHESPAIKGEMKQLTNPLLHYTHRDISSMLEKTNEWSEIEADLRVEAKHPSVRWWRLVRIALTVWWQQLVDKKVWKYGREGWFEGYFQMVDKLIVYTKLWERQS